LLRTWNFYEFFLVFLIVWREILECSPYWYDPANLRILSFHNSTGTRINNTTVAGNPTILLPVMDGPLAACRQQDMHFVCVQVSLDFAHLLGAGHISHTVLKSMYYLELPQQSANIMNGAGAACILSTYQGPVNIKTMFAREVSKNIIGPCLQRSPIALSGADFNLQEANIDSTTVKDQLISKLLLLGFDAICTSVFAVLCPGYSNQPHTVLNHIRQASPGPDGQIVVTSIHEFIQRIIKHHTHLQHTRLSVSASATTSFATLTDAFFPPSANLPQTMQCPMILTACFIAGRCRRS
jgi:hypothetical protein